MFFVTTDQAQITAPSQILTQGKIILFAQIHTSFQIITSVHFSYSS